MDKFKMPTSFQSKSSIMPGIGGFKSATPAKYCQDRNQHVEDFGHSTLTSARESKSYPSSTSDTSGSSSSSASPTGMFTNFSRGNSANNYFNNVSSPLSRSATGKTFVSSVNASLHQADSRDFVYHDESGYEDDNYYHDASETADSESDFDELQLKSLMSAIQAHCDTGAEDSAGVEQAVRKRLHASRKPEKKTDHCKQTNIKIQQYYRDVLQSIEEEIEIMNQKLVESREELRLRKYQSKPNPLLEKLPNYPYFKDSKKFTAPMNEDSVRKKNTEGFNFQRLPATIKWQKWEMKLLDLSVRKEVFLSLEQPLGVRKRHLETQLSRKDAKGRPTKKTRRLLRAVNREIEELTARPMFEILYNSDSTIDWMKISTLHFKGKRSPEECEGMWMTNQNLKINREPWTKEEIDRLLLIAKEHKNQDWERIAEVVGNGRSAFQCALYQQLQWNHERAKWTPEADRRLTALIKENSKKGYINFEKVASAMAGRTAKQVRRRWCDTLDPAIKKGDFTKTEDTIVNTARFYHKLNFRQIARLLPGRTPNQLRCRYTRLEFINPKQPWCQSEDEKLLHLIRTNSQRNWNYMVKHFNDRNLQQLRARYHRLQQGAKLANKKLMLLDPDYDPDDEAQREMNYVPDYDKELSALTMKYIPVASLMRMVNRKGRRGKRSRKPDPLDRELSLYFRNVDHVRKHGRDKIYFSNEEIDAVIESQTFYAEALGVNFDWQAIKGHNLKEMDPVLYRDFKSSEQCHNKLLVAMVTKHEKEGWDPSKKTLTTMLPPCYGSLIGLRSLMLSKPIHETVDNLSEDEQEERKKVEEKLQLDKFASKFGYPAVSLDCTQTQDTPPATPHHSPQSQEKTSRLATAETELGSPQLKTAGISLEIPQLNTAETELGSPQLKNCETSLESPQLNTAEKDQESPQLKTADTVVESPELKTAETSLESPHLKTVETAAQSPPLKTTESVVESPNLKTAETTAQSLHLETPLKPPETPLKTVIHPSIPRGLRYKDKCLTAEEGFRVEGAQVPIHVEEAMMKSLLKKCAKLKSAELKSKQETSASQGDPEKTRENVKTPRRSFRQGTFLDFQSFLNILFGNKGEVLQFEEIIWKLQAQCVVEMSELLSQAKNNEKQHEAIVQIIKELDDSHTFAIKEKKTLTQRLKELENPKDLVDKMRQYYKYQLSGNLSQTAQEYYSKNLQGLDQPEQFVRQQTEYFTTQLRELESSPDQYVQSMLRKCELQAEEVSRGEQELKRKLQMCEQQLQLLDNPNHFLQAIDKSFEFFETPEELINKISHLRPSISDFVEYDVKDLGQGDVEEGSDVEWQDLDDVFEENEEMLSFESALSLWCQRFISIFYMPAVMSMVNPPEDSRKDLFDAERLSCRDSDEIDSADEAEPHTPDVSFSSLSGDGSTPLTTHGKVAAKPAAKPDDKTAKYDLSKPEIPESERKELLLEKWLRYRQYKIRELEERKQRGLKDEWDEEEERFEALDREANREMVERIPGKRGRPRRLRRRRRPLPDDRESEEEDVEEEPSSNIFLQKPPASLEICRETWAVLDKYKNPESKLQAPAVLEVSQFSVENDSSDYKTCTDGSSEYVMSQTGEGSSVFEDKLTRESSAVFEDKQYIKVERQRDSISHDISSDHEMSLAEDDDMNDGDEMSD